MVLFYLCIYLYAWLIIDVFQYLLNNAFIYETLALSALHTPLK